MSSSPFPSVAGVTFPDSPIITTAFGFLKEHTTDTVYNHCVRSAYFALLLTKKLAPLAAKKPDLELTALACLLHDIGWAKTKELLSDYKRFEVDGADIAVEFISRYRGADKGKWDEHRKQRVWDVIALHTSGSIAAFGAAEVAAGHLGVFADFVGPKFPRDPWDDPMKRAQNPPAEGAVITVEEWRAVEAAFPLAGWTDESLRDLLCGICQTKPGSTFDNFVGAFGREFGFDGKGAGKEEYTAMWNAVNTSDVILRNFAYLKSLKE